MTSWFLYNCECCLLHWLIAVCLRIVDCHGQNVLIDSVVFFCCCCFVFLSVCLHINCLHVSQSVAAQQGLDVRQAWLNLKYSPQQMTTHCHPCLSTHWLSTNICYKVSSGPHHFSLLSYLNIYLTVTCCFKWLFPLYSRQSVFYDHEMLFLFVLSPPPSLFRTDLQWAIQTPVLMVLS